MEEMLAHQEKTTRAKKEMTPTIDRSVNRKLMMLPHVSASAKGRIMCRKHSQSHNIFIKQFNLNLIFFKTPYLVCISRDSNSWIMRPGMFIDSC